MINLDAMDPNSKDDSHAVDELTRQQAWCLYLSHFWSMWTSRVYEYAAILFIQRTFPGDLLPSSINGIAETVCVLASSAALGRWVDQSPNRLRPLLYSIIVNRSTVALCCALWLVVFASNNGTLHRALFSLILLLGMVEKASRMCNTLSIERDWIPTLASNSESRTVYNLTHLNTVIRRVDIACKFIAPLMVSGTLSVLEPWLAALVIAIFGALSCMLEIWGAILVWGSSSRLRKSKSNPPTKAVERPLDTSFGTRALRFCRHVFYLFTAQVDGFRYYFSTEVCVPSLGIAILHGSVLAWSGTMITWLLNCGFSYAEITVAKGIGSVFEFGSTFAFSWSVTILSRRTLSESPGGSYQLVGAKEDDDPEPADEDGTQRSSDDSPVEINSVQPSPIIDTARWSIVLLIACLLPTLAALFVLDESVYNTSSNSLLAKLIRRSLTSSDTDNVTMSPMHSSTASALIYFTFLSLSFLGRWTYDLSITQLTQVSIPPSRRSEFGGTEMAIVSVISLVHWVAAAIWHRQSDFKWLATGSVCAVAVAAIGYIAWTGRRHRRRS